MSLDELRSLTPRQFFLMVDRLEALDRPRNRTVELMTAQLIAMVGNTGFRGFDTPLNPKDFMPSLLIKKHADGKKMTKRKRSDIANNIRNVIHAFMR
jgi:hypothetical protein